MDLSDIKKLIAQTRVSVRQVLGLEKRLAALEEGGGAGGNHAALSNLDYASAGHTGFMPTTTIPDQLSDLSEDATHRVVTDTEKSTWNGKPETLDELTDVSVPDPMENDLLSFNGSGWVAVMPGSVSGGSGVNYYLISTASDIGGYKTFSHVPSTSGETTTAITVKDTDGDKLIMAFAAESLGRTLIDAGLWSCNTYVSVDASADVTVVKMKVYKRTSPGGTETLLYECTCGEINSATAELLGCEVVNPDYQINSTDRLVIKYYAATTSTTDRTVTLYYQGTDHYSRIKTPLAVLHNDLPGLQGGQSEEYNHLTDAELADVQGLGTAAFTASTNYAVAAAGVTGGDSHDHSGGDGAQIVYSTLGSIPSTFAPTSHGNEAHSTAYLAATAFSGLSKITVAASAPGGPGVGDLWVDLP